MRIISYNVNGIRAAIKKGFLDWLQAEAFDVVCLQETKATQHDLDTKQIEALGYSHVWFSAQKKGYSGVAIFSKLPIKNVQYGNGYEQSDAEGRVIMAEINGVTIVNAYFPSGTSGEERQAYKYVWLSEFEIFILDLLTKKKKVLITGDYNIAHTPIDIHDPKSNKNTSGFLPEERAWMDTWFGLGLHDGFRTINKEPHNYSWWSQRFPSVRLQNKGWRIDYISVSEALVKKIADAKHYADAKHSDHCAVYLKLDL
jgi:exodeoxyribonuclease III